MDPQRILELIEEKVGTKEKDSAYLELLVSQKERDAKEEAEKAKRAEAKKHYEKKLNAKKKAPKDASPRKTAAKMVSAGLALVVGMKEIQMHPGKSVLARAMVSRGGNPQRGTDFMLNETDDCSLVETDSSGLFRTDDTGYAHVPLKLKDESPW